MNYFELEENIKLSKPSLRALIINLSTIGFPDIFNIGFGVFLVKGRSLLPFPPAIITNLFCLSFTKKL